MDVLAASGRALPMYLALLGDADPEVRAAAAAVAARLEDARDQVLPALRRLHHAETESAVRAVTAYLLGACAADEDRASIQTLASLGEPLLVRASAALGLVDGRPESVGPMIAAGIRQLLSCDEDVVSELQALWDGTIACLTRREGLLSVLDELPRAEATLVFPGLLERMERSGIGWLHVFGVARRIAFGDREVAPLTRVTDLDSLQRALLESLARALATQRETSVPWLAGFEIETGEELRAFLDGRRPAAVGSAP
jgi:hypothetical protein